MSVALFGLIVAGVLASMAGYHVVQTTWNNVEPPYKYSFTMDFWASTVMALMFVFRDQIEAEWFFLAGLFLGFHALALYRSVPPFFRAHNLLHAGMFTYVATLSTTLMFICGMIWAHKNNGQNPEQVFRGLSIIALVIDAVLTVALLFLLRRNRARTRSTSSDQPANEG